MTLSSRFYLPGQIWSVATQHPSGPLYATTYGANPLETVVSSVDLSGRVRWQRVYPGTGRPRSRLSPSGTLWLARPTDGGGRALEGLLPDGSVDRTVILPCRAGEEVAAFVVLGDGFCVSWAGAAPMLLAPGGQPSRVPRVARYGRDGQCLWSTPIDLGPVSHPGMLELNAQSGREVRTAAPRPRSGWKPPVGSRCSCPATGSRPVSPMAGAASGGPSSWTWRAERPSPSQTPRPRFAMRSQVLAPSWSAPWDTGRAPRAVSAATERRAHAGTVMGR